MTGDGWTTSELLAVAAVLDCSTVPGAARLAGKAASIAARMWADSDKEEDTMQQLDAGREKLVNARAKDSLTGDSGAPGVFLAVDSTGAPDRSTTAEES